MIVNQNKTLCCQHKPISFLTRNECEKQDKEKRRYGVRYFCLKFTDQDVGLPKVILVVIDLKKQFLYYKIYGNPSVSAPAYY